MTAQHPDVSHCQPNQSVHMKQLLWLCIASTMVQQQTGLSQVLLADTMIKPAAVMIGTALCNEAKVASPLL